MKDFPSSHFFSRVIIHSSSPREDLVVAILKVPFLVFLDWVNQLVFMEVQDLLGCPKVRTQGHQFS